MFAGCHALLPVTGCLAIEAVSLRFRGERVFPDWTLPVVALFGVLPDLCSPHISLEARLESWSHTLLFLGVLIPVCAMVVRFFPAGARWRVACALWIASMLHLAADAVSGGIVWLYPWSHRQIGDYYLHPDTWIFYDAAFVLLTWLGWRLRQHLELRTYERELLEPHQAEDAS